MPDCCVCLTAMLEDLCVLKCGHVFHSFCIYSWIEQKKVCPLCKADVHRSHVRPLFMNFNEGGGDAPGDGDDVAAGAQTAGGAASDRREVEAAHAQIDRYRSEMQALADQLRQSQAGLQEAMLECERIRRENAACRNDARRNIADLHSEKLAHVQTKERLSEQVDELLHVIDEQKAEIGRMALRDRIASVADVDSVKAVSILEGHCRGMSSDTKVRFLKDQLLYTHDLYAKMKRRSQTLEREVSSCESRIQSLEETIRKSRRGAAPQPAAESDTVDDDDVLVVEDVIDEAIGLRPDRQRTPRLLNRPGHVAPDDCMAPSRKRASPENVGPENVDPEPGYPRPQTVVDRMRVQPLPVLLARSDKRRPRSVLPNGFGGSSSSMSVMSTWAPSGHLRPDAKIRPKAKSADIRAMFGKR
ncbi:RING-type domain-containing protein [Plasmodiophora brassicae]